MIPRKRVTRQFKILALDRYNVAKRLTVESNTHYGALCWLEFKILALDRYNVTKWMTIESNTYYGALCGLEFMAKGEGSTLIGDVELV